MLLTFYSANTWRVFHLSSLVVSWAFDLLIALPALKYTSALALTYICSMVLNSAKVQLDSVVLYWIWYLPKLLGLGWVSCMWSHGGTWCSHNEIGGDLVNEQNLTFKTMLYFIISHSRPTWKLGGLFDVSQIMSGLNMWQNRWPSIWYLYFMAERSEIATVILISLFHHKRLLAFIWDGKDPKWEDIQSLLFSIFSPPHIHNVVLGHRCSHKVQLLHVGSNVQTFYCGESPRTS